MSGFGGGSKVEITGVSPFGNVKIDGVDVSSGVTDATLRLRAGNLPELEVTFLAANTVTELGNVDVTYYASAFGEHAAGGDPVTVLRKIADAIEAKRAVRA